MTADAEFTEKNNKNKTMKQKLSLRKRKKRLDFFRLSFLEQKKQLGRNKRVFIIILED